jgi:predicted O-methyltransferase YrrM
MTTLRSILKQLLNFFYKILYPELRVAFSIDSHVTFKEKIILYKLSQAKSVIAEIGSYTGASACCFGASANLKVNTRIICIDTFKNDGMSEGYREVFKDFQKNTESFRDFITTIVSKSTDAVNEVYKITSYFDLLFIDGDHSYQGCRLDWLSYKNFLKPGSIIAFHDYGWAEGVKRVIQEDVLPNIASYNKSHNMWWGILAKKP